MILGRLFSVMTITAMVAVATPSTVAGEPSEAALIEGLRAQIEALSERVAALEASGAVASRTQPGSSSAGTRTTEPLVASVIPVTPAAPENDRTRFVGDLRYRHEAFNVESARERHRHRVRARASVIADVNDEVELGLGLASGNDDPVSTNQTLGDGSSSKNVVIELAYARWQTPIEGLNLQAGKFKNPIRRAGGNSLIWDGDLNPEGLAATYRNGGFFGNALASFLDESSSDDDSYLAGLQFGIDHDVGADAKLTLGMGYFNFIDSRGEPTFFDDDPRGNRVDAEGNYLSGFELAEAFVEYAFAIADGELLLMGDYVRNLAAAGGDYDTGFAVGARYTADRWTVGWAYQDIEPDAVLGLYTNSDFVGGGTDGKGHIIQAGYALTERVDLSGTLFLNERNIDFGDEEDYRRLQLDVSFKY